MDEKHCIAWFSLNIFVVASKSKIISLINDYNMSFSCAVIQYIIHVCTNPNEKRCGPGTDVTDLLQCIWINHRFR